jgi:hypothetical protein
MTRGRCIVVVIGVDHYAAWPRLANAVGDARGAASMFERLGFVQLAGPLLDHAATGAAIRRLVMDELARLTPEDSLVIVFAGHGHMHTARFGDCTVRTGYLIPVDGAAPDAGMTSTWIRLDAWLSDVARLPPRHILVILDACHSGVALAGEHRWRDMVPPEVEDRDALGARRSRRILTSALDTERALDGGPYPGHSRFMGCVLEALSGGLAAQGRRRATGRELGHYVQQRVRCHPHASQTPDHGAFELDDRGDLVFPALGVPTIAAPRDPPEAPRRRRAARPRAGSGLDRPPPEAPTFPARARRDARHASAAIFAAGVGLVLMLGVQPTRDAIALSALIALVGYRVCLGLFSALRNAGARCPPAPPQLAATRPRSRS